MKVVNKFITFRQEQFEELQRGMSSCGMKLGDVTTLNLTMLKVKKQSLLLKLILEGWSYF